MTVSSVQNDAEKIELRRAHREDKDAIKRIYVATTGTNQIPDETFDRLLESGGLVIAESVNQILGFGGIDVTASEQLKWLYIFPDYQSFGLGSKILLRLETIGWDFGLRQLRVHASPDAVGFYELHGYVRVDDAHQTKHDHEGVEMVKSRSTVTELDEQHD